MQKLILSVALMACFGCGGPPPPVEVVASCDSFPDLIDHRVVPAAAEDWSIMPFADQGAWFGFGLPVGGVADLGVGFTGPFLMASGRWFAPQLVRLEIPDVELVEARALPGRLAALWRAGEIEIEQQLWFDSAEVALIRSEIRNQGERVWNWDAAWRGATFDVGTTVDLIDHGLAHELANGDRVQVVTAVDRGERISVDPGASTTLTIAVSMAPVGDPEPDVAAALADVEASLVRNELRWNGYLEATAVAGQSGDPARIVAVKAMQTLVNNWRGPAGRFAHGGLFPSSNVWYFNGFWAWDSWKHAVALARFAPEVAADQMRLMAAQQDDAGMIADVVYLDPEEDNWRDTKPPLLGWALEEVLAATGDLEMVRELYPRLVRYHEFWYADRDHDRDGLCEYGSTDGTLEAARWESGMDNAVRFDETTMLQNSESAWSMDQESVDLNSYLYREKLALRNLAAFLDKPGDADRWAMEAAALRDLIQVRFFDEATGWFYDTAIDTGEIIPVQGPEGWIPLWAGVATDEQAQRAREIMLDPEVFRTKVPFPTVAANHPEFSEGYWRGLVWLDQVNFAIEGLRAYGYSEDADALTAQVLANLEGAAVPGEPLYENYHPHTGEGRNVRHFSWTAAHLLLLSLESQ